MNARAASLAALASVFVGSESFLVYSAGQLSTTSAAPLYLNALPYLYEWVRYGRRRAFLKATVLFMAAAAAHHATLLFGSFFFALPVLALVLLERNDGEPTSTPAFVGRTVVITVVVGIAIAVVLLPFWIALIHNPVKQTPIPHPSRANYILSPQWGLNYFIIPWGGLILVLPFIVLRGAAMVRLRPLLIGFWVAFLIGLGGTTPAGHLLLGRAYEVLTMERFTYWASLLALPFVGLLAVSLSTDFAGEPSSVWPLARLLPVDSRWHGSPFTWRMLAISRWNQSLPGSIATVTISTGTSRLGFGNKISRLAVLTDASSVDGEWNSGRTLPELTENSGGSLSNSKYFGKGGLDALRAMLYHADRYGLKWIFVQRPVL